jgi:hypothetical protein
MIALRLQGGLGNQLFQFAFGHEASQVTGLPLVADTRLLQAIGQHSGYELGRLGLGVACDLTEVHRQFPIWRVWLAERFPGYLGESLRVLHEPSLDKVRAVAGPPLMIKGYWQTGVVSEAATALVVDAVLKFSDTHLDQDAGRALVTSHHNAVAVHVRRGDYVSNNKISAQFGAATTAYFQLAMDELRLCLEDPRFYIFSDDADWSYTVFKGQSDVSIVSRSAGEESTALPDLCRMISCRHFILSNSSLSWWAAHLAGAIQTQPFEVRYPAPWFDAPHLQVQSDGIPKRSWRGLPKRGVTNSGP